MNDIVKLAATMKAAAEKASKIAQAEWGVDTERQDDAPGAYDEFAMSDGLGHRMFGTENSDANFGEIHEDFDEDGQHAWNEPSRLVMKHAEAAQPDNVLALIAAYDAQKARAEAAEVDAARLREALKPFAGPFPDFTEAWHDDAQLWAQNGDAIIVKMTLGDLRRARAALADEARS